jgi:hypothetical protein
MSAFHPKRTSIQNYELNHPTSLRPEYKGTDYRL